MISCKMYRVSINLYITSINEVYVEQTVSRNEAYKSIKVPLWVLTSMIFKRDLFLFNSFNITWGGNVVTKVV